MSNKVYFEMKRRNNSNKELTTEDYVEAAIEALLLVDSLLFLIGRLDLEDADEDLRINLKNVTSIASGLALSVLGNLENIKSQEVV